MPGDRFICNICGHAVSSFPEVRDPREEPSCEACGSSVRMRGIIHHLSLGLFQKSIPLPDFPVSPQTVGVGLSDWEGYAVPLARRFSYTNTFYHQEPQLDITRVPSALHKTCDFLISTDVLEHIPPPVERGFEGSYQLLKPGGLLVFTVPFTNVPHTAEHFPDLADFRLLNFEGEHVLVNRTRDGEYSIHKNIRFHGGEGTVVEMRVFGREDTIQMLRSAGFVDIKVHEEVVPQWGVIPPHLDGLPITARRPG